MSQLGPMNFGPQYESNNYGMLWGKPFEVSEHLQAKVDQEIGRLITEAQTQAEKLLKKYRVQLDKIAQRLLAVETLDADEFEALMGMPKVKVKLPAVKS